jgi:hypothetical protein
MVIAVRTVLIPNMLGSIVTRSDEIMHERLTTLRTPLHLSEMLSYISCRRRSCRNSVIGGDRLAPGGIRRSRTIFGLGMG